MKRMFSVSLLGLMILISLTLLNAQQIFDAPGRFSVSAMIDSKCNPQSAPFTIAAGFRAQNFTVAYLDAGFNCVTGQRVTEKRFDLSGPGTSYSMFVNVRDRVTETGGRLSALILGAGTYSLSVSGGRDARIQLTFDLMAWPPPPPTAPAPQDSDGDGVIDSWDLEPNTPPNSC